MIATAATLFIGVLIGYMGQRSRFCIISGIRDWLILRSLHRLKGLLGLIIGAEVGFTVFKFIGGDVPSFPMFVLSDTAGYWIASVVGGIGIGFYSILAEGCPFRQHVMAAEGQRSAMFYLLGFYVGIVYFYIVTFHLLELLLTATG